MYRILIADDEPLEREGMRLILSKLSSSSRTLEIVEAENGKEAVQKAVIYKPDIIFMDIRMPGMDGLQAITHIQEQLPRAKYVLVSAYDDFNYAQKAIRLSVHDYLVKPAHRSDIIAIVEKLIEQIEQETLQDKQQLEHKRQLNDLLPLVKAELALSLISEKINEDELYMLSDSLNIKLNTFISIVVAFPDVGGDLKTAERTIRQLQSELAHDSYHNICSTLINEHIVWFLISESQSTAALLLDEAYKIGSLIYDKLKALNPEQSILVGIGDAHDGIQGARRSYYEAVFSSTTGNEHHITQFHHMDLAISQPYLHKKAEQFSFVQQAIILIRQEREQQTFSMLNQAERYIEKHYMKEISLEEVAEYVHLNPFYFSKLFKQQTGETFIDYVTRIRIEHAKQLMSNREHSLKEICYMVGYNDPNYFSRVFKKVTGKTPTEYRALH